MAVQSSSSSNPDGAPGKEGWGKNDQRKRGRDDIANVLSTKEVSTLVTVVLLKHCLQEYRGATSAASEGAFGQHAATMMSKNNQTYS